MPTRWIKEEEDEWETGETGYIWTNRKDPRLTVEIHTFLSDDVDDEGNIIEDAITMWYIYPAYDDRWLPNSPDIQSSEKDALWSAKKYLRMSNDAILAMRSPYDDLGTRGRSGPGALRHRPPVRVRPHRRRA